MMIRQGRDLLGRIAGRPGLLGLTLAAGVFGGTAVAHATAVFDGFISSMRTICTEQPSASCAYAVTT